jgi:hypothetical protein
MSERVTVTIDDKHLGRLDDIADRLQGAGMQVEQVLQPIGIITGSVSPTQRHSLEDVPGVAAVEGESSFQLAPPDADVQ